MSSIDPIDEGVSPAEEEELLEVPAGSFRIPGMEGRPDRQELAAALGEYDPALRALYECALTSLYGPNVPMQAMMARHAIREFLNAVPGHVVADHALESRSEDRDFIEQISEAWESGLEEIQGGIREDPGIPEEPNMEVPRKVAIAINEALEAFQLAKEGGAQLKNITRMFAALSPENHGNEAHLEPVAREWKRRHNRIVKRVHYSRSASLPDRLEAVTDDFVWCEDRLISLMHSLIRSFENLDEILRKTN